MKNDSKIALPPPSMPRCWTKAAITAPSAPCTGCWRRRVKLASAAINSPIPLIRSRNCWPPLPISSGVGTSPNCGAPQFGDVPTPELIGSGGQQFRLLIRGMGELIAALASFTLLRQQPVHGADGAVIAAFVQQRGIDGGGRAILESFFMQAAQNGFPLRLAERAGRYGRRGGANEGSLPPVERRPGDAEDGAGGLDTHHGSEFGDGGHQGFSSRSGARVGRPSSAATFF